MLILRQVLVKSKNLRMLKMKILKRQKRRQTQLTISSQKKLTRKTPKNSWLRKKREIIWFKVLTSMTNLTVEIQILTTLARSEIWLTKERMNVRRTNKLNKRLLLRQRGSSKLRRVNRFQSKAQFKMLTWTEWTGSDSIKTMVIMVKLTFIREWSDIRSHTTNKDITCINNIKFTIQVSSKCNIGKLACIDSTITQDKW